MIKRKSLAFFLAAIAILWQWADLQAFTYQHCGSDLFKWSSPSARMRASSVSFPEGSFEASVLSTSIDLWNRNPSNFRFRLTFGDNDVEKRNGQSEIWFADPSHMDGAAGITMWDWNDDCEITEADIKFDASMNWVDANGAVSQDILNAYAASDQYFFRTVALHELGHAFGLDEGSQCYTIMGMCVTHLSTNCSGVSSFPGEDASDGAVFLYGANTTAAEDLGVSHWKYAGVTGDEPYVYSLHWRTEMYDPAGNPLPTMPTPEVAEYKSSRFHNVTYLVNNGASLQVEFTYENNGSNTQTNVPVDFVLSGDDCITTADRWIGSTWFTLYRDWPSTFADPVNLPDDLLEGANYSIGAIIDPANSIAEFEESNNACPIDIQVLPIIPISLLLTPSAVDPGGSSVGTVFLSAPASSAGARVSLSVDAPAIASVPTSITIPHGATSANFTVTTTEGFICGRNYFTVSASRAGTTVSADLIFSGSSSDYCNFTKQDWFDIFEHSFICLDLTGGTPGIPGEFGGSGGSRCPTPGGCFECIFTFAGDPVPVPPYVRDLESGILGILHDPGRPFPPAPWLENFRAAMEKVPVGGYFDRTLKTRAIDALIAFGGNRLFTNEIGAALMTALHAIELDLRVPPLRPQSVAAGPGARIDFAGAAKARLSNVERPGEMSLHIQAGVPSRLPGYTPGWPVVAHKFDFTGTLGPEGHFDISLNLKGINFARDPSALRVFAWDGKRYSDVTTNLDLSEGVISARIEKPATLVIMNKDPRSNATKGGRLQASRVSPD
jgi:hypothetical protein